MDKMQIYNSTRSVPETAKKQFNNGSFSGTDINPMWRIKVLTEQFGPCGAGWYYEITDKRCEEHHDMTMAIVDVKLYWNLTGDLANPKWSAPVYGTGGNKLVTTTKSGMKSSDEGYKMALTDALSVACKALGIGADVYFEKDATSKYSEYYTQQQPKPQMTVTRKPTSAMLTVLDNKTTDEQKAKLRDTYGENYERLDFETCDRLLKKLGGKQ